MAIRITYDDAYYKDDDKFIICIMYYDNGFALAGYYDSSNNKFAAEAKAFVEFRDKCWTICYDFLNRYNSGEIRRPLPAEVLNAIYLQLGEYIHA
jgi:hypothetical protein